MNRLLRTEMVKQWLRVRTWVALGIAAAIPIIIAIALKTNPPDRRGENAEAFFRLALSTGLLVPAAALRMMSRFLLIILVALFTGDAIAGEAAWGNLRYLLIRPVRRSRLLTAKLLVSFSMAITAAFVVVIAGAIAGVLAFGYHGIHVPFLGIDRSAGSLVGHLIVSTLYVIWCLSPVVGIAIMVSVMTDTPSGAILAAVGGFITTEIIDAISSVPAWIRHIMPSHYLDAWTEWLTRGTGGADLRKGVLLALVYDVVLCGVAYWWFNRKDVLS